MVRFLKRDPLSKAKKHIEKALSEMEAGYPDYASEEYEKAARLFIEAEEVDFAVKYFREAAYCALEKDDHSRAAGMKTDAAEALVFDGRFEEGGAVFSEASDHYHREKKTSESVRTLSMSILCYLAARNFDTATNLLRKAEKRFTGAASPKVPAYDLAAMGVRILCEGEVVDARELAKSVEQFKAKPVESTLVTFVASSLRLALETEVSLEWAGRIEDIIRVKTPIEFELRYKCPVPVRVIDHRIALSSNLSLTKAPKIKGVNATEESWLIEVNPILNGTAVVGPLKLTLEGDKVLVHKHSDSVTFEVAPAPALLQVDLSPQRISCGLGDEVVLDVTLANHGDGPASNIDVNTEFSPGLELAMGSGQKSIQFIGTGEHMRFQLYMRAVKAGESLVTVKIREQNQADEIVKTALVRVG